MEKFFKPVHSSSAPDEVKPRKHHHHHHHHLQHHQDPQSHRYTTSDDTDRNTDESQGHHHHHHPHGQYVHDGPHHHHTHHRHSIEDEILYDHDTSVTLSRASSSSSLSSSSSSWCTEASTNNPFTLQHSLSCSNISDVHRGFREDEPIVHVTIKHGSNGPVCSQSQGHSQQRGKRGLSSLDRSHSRSEEDFLHCNECDQGEQSRVPHINHRSLYKTVSLSQNLAVSEQDIHLGVTRGPKRAVSSIQLPTKGILKNKEPPADIRKSKSMEVLSPRVGKGQDPSGQKGKGASQAGVEQARANFVHEKLQFSAFLDEITKQVISPSALNNLGLNKDKTSGKAVAPVQTPSPVKPQLPPKKHRESSSDEKEPHPKQHKKRVDCSGPDRVISHGTGNSRSSPQPHHYHHSPSPDTHHGSSRKERRPSPSGSSMSGDRHGRGGPHLTDDTSTSPEPSHPKQKHHRKQQNSASHGLHPHTQHVPQPQHQQAHPGPGQRGQGNALPSPAQDTDPGVRFDSSPCKLDCSRARDRHTASRATSHISEPSGRHHLQHSKQCRDTLCDVDHLRALQEENADLHQNLLQTVVCIESLEVELERTRDELSHVKEKYKSLLETHSGTKQANNLHVASDSQSSERKYLQNRVVQLTSELEDAHRTIAALENINVPCLMRDLLEKHFDSAEALQKFLPTSGSAPAARSAATPHADDQSHAPKAEEPAHDWPAQSEAGPQRITAFMPFKQGASTPGGESSLPGQRESSLSPPLSVADISIAIYKKMAAGHAVRPQPLYPQCQRQRSQGTNHTDALPGLPQAHVADDSWAGKGGPKVLEQDVGDVSSMSAQQILDDFMQQLQAHKEAGDGREQQGGQQ